MIALFSVLSTHFLTYDTFSTIANQIPDLVVMSVGMTFVLVIASQHRSFGGGGAGAESGEFARATTRDCRSQLSKASRPIWFRSTTRRARISQPAIFCNSGIHRLAASTDRCRLRCPPCVCKVSSARWPSGGIEIEPNAIQQNDFSATGGYAAASVLFDTMKSTTTFACNDMMGIGALRAAAERGNSRADGLFDRRF